MDRTLYITDLDGTLLNTESTLSTYTIGTINTLVDKGLIFTYATARSLYSALPVTKGLTTNLPVIIYNGCAIINAKTRELLYSCQFSKEEIVEVKEILKDNYPFVYSYIDEKETVSYYQKYVNDGMQFYLDKRKDDPRFNPVDHQDIYQGRVFYFTCIGKKEDLEKVYYKIKDKDKYHVVFHQEIYREEYWLEIMPKNATKANAILKLKEILKIDKIVSFGDAINDLPMFLISDECYAVENAVTELKNIATGIIQSNNQDGVAKWLENHGK